MMCSLESTRSRRKRTRGKVWRFVVVTQVCDKLPVVECVPLWCNLMTTTIATSNAETSGFFNKSKTMTEVWLRCCTTAHAPLRDRKVHFWLLSKESDFESSKRRIPIVSKEQKKIPINKEQRRISKSFPYFPGLNWPMPFKCVQENQNYFDDKPMPSERKKERCGHPDPRFQPTSESDCVSAIQHFLQIGLSAAVVKSFVSGCDTQETEWMALEQESDKNWSQMTKWNFPSVLHTESSYTPNAEKTQ